MTPGVITGNSFTFKTVQPLNRIGLIISSAFGTFFLIAHFYLACQKQSTSSDIEQAKLDQT